MPLRSKPGDYRIFIAIALLTFPIHAFAQLTEAKPMIDQYDAGLYDLIVKLRSARHEAYNACLNNNGRCSNIFSTDLLYSLEENGIGYHSEASFLSELKNKQDIGIDNRQFYLIFSYGCRIRMNDRIGKQFVAIYLPHPNYYNYIKPIENVTFTNSTGRRDFSFRKINFRDTNLLFNDDNKDVAAIVTILRERQKLALSMADNAITSSMDYVLPDSEEDVFNRLCKMK